MAHFEPENFKGLRKAPVQIAERRMTLLKAHEEQVGAPCPLYLLYLFSFTLGVSEPPLSFKQCTPLLGHWAIQWCHQRMARGYSPQPPVGDIFYFRREVKQKKIQKNDVNPTQLKCSIFKYNFLQQERSFLKNFALRANITSVIQNISMLKLNCHFAIPWKHYHFMPLYYEILFTI